MYGFCVAWHKSSVRCVSWQCLQLTLLQLKKCCSRTCWLLCGSIQAWAPHMSSWAIWSSVLQKKGACDLASLLHQHTKCCACVWIVADVMQSPNFLYRSLAKTDLQLLYTPCRCCKACGNSSTAYQNGCAASTQSEKTWKHFNQETSGLLSGARRCFLARSVW